MKLPPPFWDKKRWKSIIQPERLRRVDAEKRSDSLNSTETSREKSEEVSPPENWCIYRFRSQK